MRDEENGCRGRAFPPTPPNMPITDRLNLALVGLVVAGAVALVFSFLMLTDYALLHEAAHGNLHSRPRMNSLLGIIAGVLFPIPFTMIYTTHQGHHLRNRTDFEMFDLYYPTDNRFVKYLRWYGILCGFFWPFIPIGALLFAICPGMLRWKIWQKDRVSRYLLSDIRAAEVRSIRTQVILTAAFFALLFIALDLRWQNTLVLYACFSVNWSTRQYVGHAFTRRDVIEGAWNLRTNRFMSWILLHGEYDLNHHRRPEVPWYYLPRLSAEEEARPSYLRQYWRQWLGPRLATEPAPESLEEIPLSVHQ